jgi:hypothetical protein
MITCRPWIAAALVAAPIQWGCAGRMDRVAKAVQGYETALTLRAGASGVTTLIGDPITLHLTLLNRALQPVSACLGPNHRFLLRSTPMKSRDGRPPLDEHLTLVDHPTCGQRFELPPGEALSWETRLEFKDIGSGAAELDASVQVLHPRDCDQYGCYGTMIAAPPVPLHLLRREP